jgi:hypothetical protein
MEVAGLRIPMMRKKLIFPLVALLLAGCAAPHPALYRWDDYQKQVYESLKGDGTPAQQLTALQEQAEKARAKGQALPPGFRAQLGLLHLRLGDIADAKSNFEAEEAAFPEAKPYMDFLLKGMTEKKTS